MGYVGTTSHHNSNNNFDTLTQTKLALVFQKTNQQNLINDVTRQSDFAFGKQKNWQTKMSSWFEN